MSDLDSTLHLTSHSSLTYQLYRRRFYIIFVFGLLTFNQCLIWLIFSPIARNAEVYYNITETTVDLFLNWENIVCIPTFPMAYLLLNKPQGLRLSMIVFAVTSVVATILRIIPSIISSLSNPHFSSIAVPFLHSGQILNAICAPLVKVPISQLSWVWFGPNERARATTFALMINNFGAAVGFLIGPLIVDVPEHVPHLLYVHLSPAILACILTHVYFPSHPPTPPSPATERLLSYSISDNGTSFLRGFLKDFYNAWSRRHSCSSPSQVVSRRVYSVRGQVCTMLFLHPKAIQKCKQVRWWGIDSYNYFPCFFLLGWSSFGSIIAGIIGGLCLGALADMRRFQRSLKMFMIVSLVGCFLAIIWFELSVHTLFYDKPILCSTPGSIELAIALAGLFQGASSPIIYEALAEIMFPLPESLSA